jgi:ankyrin repeat protein
VIYVKLDGFNPRQRDNYGQTTLHLACINGNLTAVTELCEQVSLFHYLYLPLLKT